MSIDDIPSKIWFDVSGGANLLLLVVKGKYTYQELHERWIEIQQSYIDEFGLDENMAQRIRLQRELIQLKCEFALTGNRRLTNDIFIVESDLDLLNEGEKVKFEDVQVKLERSFHVVIDGMKTSAKKWYYYIKNAR